MEKLRAWINRDDGNLYQIGNEKLNALEVVGYFLVIGALVIGVLHSQLDFLYSWVGWVVLIIGLGIAFYGSFRKERDLNNDT